MNIVLFESSEITGTGQVVLAKRDPRGIHLIKVLHKKAGDSFEAGVLQGKKGKSRIEQIGSDGSIICSLDVTEEAPRRLPVRIEVGFPRPIQVRRILRDLSGMGIESIDLVGTDTGEKSYQDTTLLTDGGARAALIEGAIQARDTILPHLHQYRNFDELLLSPPWQPDSFLVAADNVSPAGSFFDPTNHHSRIVIAIGSERGFSDRERKLLEEAGFIRLSMGDRPLRTESACIAAAILSQIHLLSKN
ncbi:ribosomal RNA small subunit methyltransferase E [Spirochaetia bacterium]|nr:ribosomal RNA small subunit methyltransferase E [Spirochaetia bacterium]GHU29701.1 ribosomal RNA small subunit methyltransferase E [Spirochaetia bacterium]